MDAAPVAATVPLLALIPVWEVLASIPLRHAVPGTAEIAGIAIVVTGIFFWWLGYRSLPAASKYAVLEDAVELEAAGRRIAARSPGGLQ
jgi:protein-S-isoprenylcysteine O-methyltransferase Ste14